MKKNIGKKVVVASVILAVLLFFSAAGLNTLATNTDTTTLLVELENSGQLQQLQDNGRVLVDYDNGWVLLQVPKAQLNAYRNAYNTRMDDSRYEINLWASGYEFDRRQGMPEIPSELRYDDLSGVKPYVVQFIGPIPSYEWKQQVIDSGADIHADIGNYAVLTRMDASTRRNVDNLDIVAWTGVYHPAYKISESIADKEGTMEIYVTPWDGVSLNSLATDLDHLGASVGRIVDNGVVATVDANMLPAIAAMNNVYSVDRYARAETTDNMANQIHEVQGAWYTSWSGLPVRLLGEGQIIGMQDTGFDGGWDDEGHPDFFSGYGGDRVVRYTDREGGSDPDGENSAVAHGTHCAGIIAGNGWCWREHMGADPNDRLYHMGEGTGVAPEAHLSMDGCTDDRGGFYPTMSYIVAQESDGARTFSNSWGTTGDIGYTARSTELDRMLDTEDGNAMTHAYENVIVFAAGNDGPDIPTIGGQASAKNVFSVGASENYRPEWHSAENPGNVADFSSRGGDPTGRVTPDVVAVGTAQIAAFGFGEWNYYVSTGQGVPQPGWFQEVDEYDYLARGPGSDGRADYQYMQGTSMACPQIAGMVALTREYYTKVHGITNPSNSLVRATLISGADRMNPQFPYPGYEQGWGRPNLRNSLYPDAPTSNQYYEGRVTTTGNWDLESFDFNLNINSGDVPLKATLVWIDSSGETLNRRMHLTATDPSGDNYRSGWTNYDGEGWTIPNRDVADNMNYVQRIEIEAPESGNWDFTLHATNMPSAANFAIVLSGDFGPQDTYDVDLQTDYPTTLSLVDGGNTILPIRVRNWGTSDDDILISHNSADITVGLPGAALELASQEQTIVNVNLGATGVAAGVYRFEITGTSQGDASVQDTIRVTVQVLDEQLPYREIAAGDTADERWADVLTFEDSSGTPWIFITYLMDTLGGDRIFVKYSQLGTNGRPIGWEDPIMVDTGDGNLDYPSWAKLQHNRNTDRVFVYWIGRDPANVERTPAYITWADHGNYDSWTSPRLIDYNTGGSTNNVKRCVYMLWRDDGTSHGELTYVFEHLDNDGAPSYNIVGIGIHYRISTDGGASWSGANAVPGAGGGGDYYYFFPSGITDQNEVNWHFFYYRESAGNTRVVVVKLQEGTSWSSTVEIMGDINLDSHNWQFPRAAHANQDGTNTIYVSALYDWGGAGQDISTGYVQGNFGPGNPPASFTTFDGAMGGYVVESGYMESNVLSMTTSYDDEDGWYAWTGYQETDTAFDVPNLDAGRSNDLYSTVEIDYVTRDNYAKLNPQMSSLEIDGNHYVYMTYHASYGTLNEVDYQIYLSVFHAGYRDDPDTEGPVTSGVSVNPNPVGAGHPFDITANIDDTQTGFSGIQAAEFTVTEVGQQPTWPGFFMTVSGSSPIETATALGVTSGDLGIGAGDWHIWVRGQDEHGNWGDEYASYTLLTVEVPDALPPSIELLHPVGGETYNAGDTLTILWDATQGDGAITGINLAYSIDGGSFQTIVTGAPDTGSYDWTVPDAHNDFTRIRATVVDANALTASDTSGGFSITGIPPSAPASMDVEHTGVAGTQEWVDNGHFDGGYTPEWALDVLQNDGVADWDEDGYEEGGSIYVHTGISNTEGNVLSQEAQWTQTIDPPLSGEELGLSMAVNKYVFTEWGGGGGNQQSYAYEATIMLQVYDTGPEDWVTVLQHVTIASLADWQEVSGTYTPEGAVNSVRAYMYAEVEGNNGGGGPNAWNLEAQCLLAVDAISITSEGGEEADDDNLITWNASPDDPDKVTHYHVYRSVDEDEAGPYEHIVTISATGSTSYSYIDSNRGTADETFWWYQVYSDANGQYSDEPIGPVQEPGDGEEPDPDPTFQISLEAGGAADGWNFVSFNLELTETDLETILTGVEFTKAMYYDAAAGQWRSYVPERAERFNNLDNWNHHMGLWIQVTADTQLEVQGTAPESTDITLHPGWNMVGLPSDTPGNHGLPGQVSVVGHFSADAEYNMVYDYDPATFEFEPGQGYMVYLDHTEPVVWTVDY